MPVTGTLMPLTVDVKTVMTMKKLSDPIMSIEIHTTNEFYRGNVKMHGHELPEDLLYN